jgi:hypothetical protein
MAEPNESDDVMSKIQQKQLDDILLDQAYNNSWLILSGQISFEELLEKDLKSGKEVIMCFDPDEGPKKEQLENMISYYIDCEEYEKCGKLQSILNEIYPK